jgi:hypothetical protein
MSNDTEMEIVLWLEGVLWQVATALREQFSSDVSIDCALKLHPRRSLK